MNYTIPSFGTLSLIFVAEPPTPTPILCLPPASSSKASERPSRLPIPKNPPVCAGPQAVQHQPGLTQGPRSLPRVWALLGVGQRAAVRVSGASHLPPHLGPAPAPAPPPAGGGRPARTPQDAARCWHLHLEPHSVLAFHKHISQILALYRPLRTLPAFSHAIVSTILAHL